MPLHDQAILFGRLITTFFGEVIIENSDIAAST